MFLSAQRQLNSVDLVNHYSLFNNRCDITDYSNVNSSTKFEFSLLSHENMLTFVLCALIV